MEEVDAIATNCNKRKMAAKKAEVRSSPVCLCTNTTAPSSRLSIQTANRELFFAAFVKVYPLQHHSHSSCPAQHVPPHPAPPQVLGEVHERGMVIQVLDKAFDVVIAQYGTIQRVHMEVRRHREAFLSPVTHDMHDM